MKIRFKSSVLSFTVTVFTFAILTQLPSCRNELPQDSDAVPNAKAAQIESISIGSIENLHSFGKIYLSAQPAQEDFALLKKNGVKTVINMRKTGENNDFDEEKAVTDAGMRYFHKGWKEPSELTDDLIDQVRGLLTADDGKTLIHCSSANRVGAMWIPFRVLDQGASFEDALAEAKKIGLRSEDYEAKAKDYIERKK